MAKRKSDFNLWVEGARLRTLPLAIAPIIVASGIANTLQAFDWVKTLLALAVALFLQIGVNYANDYSDGVRGTDSNRVGPLRLTGSGTFKPKTVKLVAFGFLALGGLSGLSLIALTQLWWLLGVGVAAILAAWFYTGGKRPYGYAGLGELVVFIFFGIVAVFGTVYVQFPSMFDSAEVKVIAAPGAIGLGLFASAVLMINNIRDIETDRPVGKKTLAVRLGKNFAKALYLLMIWSPLALGYVYLVIQLPYAFVFPLALILLLVPMTLIVLTAKTPMENILALKLTSYAALLYSVLLALGLWKLV
ncbi:MAG: 1,4-dihydroxy-2-naphthoate polyprenyltransferase [Rhodoluna sp.]|nr:1,4-dihydroxy-2-naphthoate polyprenyltransferase [Rhodoluna sp.]